MDKEILFDIAVDLGHSLFDAPTVDHIERIYVWLRMNTCWEDLDDGDGATVH